MSNEPRQQEVILSMAEPTRKFGELQFVQIGVSERFIIVATGGTLENTGEVVNTLRLVADALEGEACG